ncbi:MAG: hypothetical protein DRJ98_08150 [Thermoprotei archaeon]|nr:MAG: hypothetical protein DRJ98_08150 [Thermoprotei archaeon]
MRVASGAQPPQRRSLARKVGSETYASNAIPRGHLRCSQLNLGLVRPLQLPGVSCKREAAPQPLAHESGLLLPSPLASTSVADDRTTAVVATGREITLGERRFA